ncbi:MAG: insulinase family protein [Spirochaetia bacterium]|nr:insulinase family protein [Spirochaetia bacterium]
MKFMRRTTLAAVTLALAVAFLGLSCVGTPRAAVTGLPGGSSYELDDPLPLAPELIKGTLDNGLTYYVRANGNPGGRVTMYLVVAGGSSEQTDDESGYAHFVEHMAFNGTASFPENELVSYLRSIGMEFGAEVNAYTALEETLYSLEMPTDDPAHFDTGLKVLREWATAISFDPVEVEKEKGVILEEMRLGLGPEDAARKAELPVLLAGSRQATREPIGTEASVRAATAEGLKAFYERTYRPERMAVMIVGDVMPADARAAIEREFSFPSRDGKTLPRPLHPVTPTSDLSFVASFHPDFDTSVVFYEKIVQLHPDRTVGEYIDWLTKRIAAEAVRLRLSDLTRAGGKAWNDAYFDNDYFYGYTRLFAFSLSAAPGKELAAFSDLATEVERIRRHGFTDSEFKRTMDTYRRWLSSLTPEDQDIKSWTFADEYVRNFMYDEPVPGIVNERVYIRDTLDALTIDDLNDAARFILAEDEGFVAVRAKAQAADGSIREENFEAVLEAARASQLEALVSSETSGGGLFDGEPEGGSIVSESQLPNNVTRLELSNGAQVLLKPTSYDNNSISFAAWSLGGYSALPLGDYYAAVFGPTLLGAAGLGPMDALRLEEETALSEVGLAWSIGENGESMSGKSSTADLKTLLRLAYLTAAEPGQDVSAFNQLRDRLAAQVGPYAQDPTYRFETAWSAHLFGDNPRTAPLSAADIKALTLDQVAEVARGALAAASDFTYVLVGDFSLDEAKALSARYLGAIPAGSSNATGWVSPLKPRSEGAARQDYAYGKEDRATVKMIWAAETPWTWERETSMELLSAALNNRLLDAIREDLGGTYVVSVQGAFAHIPVPQYALIVSFDCDPDRVDELVAEVQAEIAAFAAGATDPKYIQQIQAAAQREYDGTLRTNQFWVRNLASAVANKLDFEILGRARRKVELADASNLVALAGELLDPSRSFVYVLLPEAR